MIVGILPASQIHGLDPAAQPRAWLDVVASANTTGEEKIEAIEEILILAKDKRRARIFLDEGILDWIIWTLSRYFEKTNADFRDVNWAHPDVTPTEKQGKFARTLVVLLPFVSRINLMFLFDDHPSSCEASGYVLRDVGESPLCRDTYRG